MRNRLIFLLVILLQLSVSSTVFSSQPENHSALTHFQWIPPAGSPDLSAENSFQVKKGLLTVTGTKELRNFGEALLRFLSESELRLSNKYSLTPARVPIQIYLIPLEEVKNRHISNTIKTQSKSGLVLPFPIDKNLSQESLFKSFALFNLLHSVVKAHLAYGNESRVPVSSHAFRFVDGLSGFLALEQMVANEGANQSQFLNYLERIHREKTTATRFSSKQLLDQNSSSESTDMLAGLNQFFSGISLSRNPTQATMSGDSSSTADRIRVFLEIQSQKSDQAIRDIIGYMSVSTDFWTIQESPSDSFCRTQVGIGCTDRSIDGTRADIILKYVTNQNFAQLLKAVKSTPQEVNTEEPLPPYPVYGFQYPTVGGANEGVITLLLKSNISQIVAKDILESEQIPQNGFHLAIGFQDEAYQIQIELDYTTGTKQREDDFIFNQIGYEVDQKLVYTDLRIGSRITGGGSHSGWKEEIGIAFHWIRLQSEWDLSDLSIKKTDLEYINRGYFLLDIQNYRAITLAGLFDIGFNLDFQLGLVNQSGSTLVARDEIYNKDISNLILGINLGPELRFQTRDYWLDIRMGADYGYLWQPLPDTGGKKGNNDPIDASQSMLSMFVTIGLAF